MRGALACLVLCLCACDATPTAPTARFWTAREYIARYDAGLDFGGWTPAQLIVKPGEPLRFVAGKQRADAWGLTVFPGVSDGQPMPFVILDTWKDHPEPWVQPVWVPGGTAPNVFPVDVGSTFYSPWWRKYEMSFPQVTSQTFESAREVLDSKATFTERQLILCPFVPEHVGGAGAPELLDPMTLARVTVPEAKEGYVDGHEIHYLNFGDDLAPFHEQRLESAQAFFFVASLGEPPLPVAAVLPDDALHHGWLDRVDVALPVGAQPYVPRGRPELRALLSPFFPQLPVPPEGAPEAPAYTLRLARDPTCFSAADFPAACDWLDTPARLAQLPAASRLEQPVQLTIGVVPPEAVDGGAP